MQLAPTLFFFSMEFCPEADGVVAGGGWKAQHVKMSVSAGRLKSARFRFKESK